MYELLDFYTKNDDRLKYISTVDLLFGGCSVRNIKNDEIILDFIEEFLDKLDKICEIIRKKQLEIIEDDQDEFDSLMSLNKKQMYSRIAFYIEKWYVGIRNPTRTP